MLSIYIALSVPRLWSGWASCLFLMSSVGATMVGLSETLVF